MGLSELDGMMPLKRSLIWHLENTPLILNIAIIIRCKAYLIRYLI